MAPRTFPHFFSFSLSRALLENELESHASLLLLLLPLFIVAVREEGGWPEIPIPAIFPMEGKAGCPDLEQISFGFPPPPLLLPPSRLCGQGGRNETRPLWLFLLFSLSHGTTINHLLCTRFSFPPLSVPPFTSHLPILPSFFNGKERRGRRRREMEGGRQSTHKGGGKRKENGREKSHYLYFLRGRDLFNLTRGGSTCIMNVHASSFEASNDPNRSE